MFKDYYKILGVPVDATMKEIVDAYRKLAFQWHPDRNPGKNTTARMQDINEAIMLLKDPEARARYDRTYLRYREHLKSRKCSEDTQGPADVNHDFHAQGNEYEGDPDFVVDDEVLKKWINNARAQAKEILLQTHRDFVGLTKEVAVTAGKRVFELVVGSVLAGFFFILVFSFACPS